MEQWFKCMREGARTEERGVRRRDGRKELEERKQGGGEIGGEEEKSKRGET